MDETQDWPEAPNGDEDDPGLDALEPVSDVWNGPTTDLQRTSDLNRVIDSRGMKHSVRCHHVDVGAGRCFNASSPGSLLCLDHGADIAVDVARPEMAGRRARRVMRTISDPYLAAAAEEVNPAQVFARLIVLTEDRVSQYGEELAEQFEAHGYEAIVGDKKALNKFGDAVNVEEMVRALISLEGQERDRLTNLTKIAMQFKIDLANHAAAEAQAETVMAMLHDVVVRLGREWGPAERDVVREVFLDHLGDGQDEVRVLEPEPL